MNQQFQCTKIKDGLYLGNVVAAHDYEFLFSNKFGFIVNCTAEIPNVFQHENIRYLKFKLVDGKPHKLWDQTLKKLTKLQKFLQQAEQTSLCCMVHSFHGQNRSLVFVIGYLMKKYQWRLKKTLQFLKSKQIFIGLSNHYIAQLQLLQEILSKNNVLSLAWTPPYINQEQQIISKTFLNSLQGKQIKPEHNTLGGLQKQQNPKPFEQEKKKKQKRVVWLDRLQKKKRKQQVSQKKAQQLLKLKQKASTHIDTVKFHIPEYDMRDPQLIKNIEFNSINKRLHSSESVRQKQQQLKKQKLVNNINNNNKNDGIPYEQLQNSNKDDMSAQSTQQKNIYQLTINNFISPNFNIINKTQPFTKKLKKKDDQKIKKEDVKDKQKQKKHPRPVSASKKSTQKINRAQSQKEVANSIKGVNTNKQSIKQGDETAAESRQVTTSVNNHNNNGLIKQQKQSIHNHNRQKKSTLGAKQRDIKKQLKKEIQKVEKQKGSQTSLHSLHPLSTLAQQLIKNQQQVTVKRSSTPVRKQRKRQTGK